MPAFDMPWRGVLLSCSCRIDQSLMCNIDSSLYDNLADFWHPREVTAHKAHRCHACGGAIEPGQRYVRHFSVHNRDPCSEKMCSLCAAISADFEDVHGVAPVPSDLRATLSECTDGAGRWARAIREMDKRGPRPPFPARIHIPIDPYATCARCGSWHYTHATQATRGYRECRRFIQRTED